MSNSLTRETPLLKRGYLTALDPPLGKWFTATFLIGWWFISLLLATPVSMAAGEESACNENSCTYPVKLDRAGFYTAVVTLPAGQSEGVWSLLINPKLAEPRYGGGFFAGSILKEHGELASWIGFSLAKSTAVQLKFSDYTGTQLPFQVWIDRPSNANPVYEQTMTPGLVYNTPLLKPGFYVTNVLSSPDALGKTFFGVDITAPNIYGGVVGGWLDSKTGPGYAAFNVSYPQTVKFELLFDGTYGTVGMGQPYLQIYYQKPDGTRELYWKGEGDPNTQIAGTIAVDFANAGLVGATVAFYNKEGNLIATYENATDANSQYRLGLPVNNQEVASAKVYGGIMTQGNIPYRGEMTALCTEVGTCHITPYSSLVMRLANSYPPEVGSSERVAVAKELVQEVIGLETDPSLGENGTQSVSAVVDANAWGTLQGDGSNTPAWFDRVATDMVDRYLDDEESRKVLVAGYQRLETTTTTLTPAGGIVKNELGDTIIEVPAGSLQSDTEFQIARGFNSLGQLIITISANKDTGPVKITLPDPDLLSNLLPPELQSSTQTVRRSTRSSDYPLTFMNAGVGYGTSCTPGDTWYCKSAQFLKINGGLGTGNRVKNEITGEIRTEILIYNISSSSTVSYWSSGIVSSPHIAAIVSSSCDFKVESCYKGKEPVLFVHGYTPSIFGPGGDEDTWGKFPARILDLDHSKYVVFAFRWITAARFEEVAADLGNAIQQIVDKTGKQVHIVAHSFGGVLTRTYLQRLAEDCPSCDTDFSYGTSLTGQTTVNPDTRVVQNKYVASVTTVGSPHSGITTDPDMTLYGTLFKQQGQDGRWVELNGEAQINLAQQVSVFQMGEDVDLSATQAGNKRWTSNSLSLYGLTYPDSESADDVKNLLKVPKNKEVGKMPMPGKFISVLANMEATANKAHPLPKDLPVQVLIGLTSDGGWTGDIDGGDGLISYEGQRLLPTLTNEGIKPLLNQERKYGGIVTEKVLGYGDVKPGDPNPVYVTILPGDDLTYDGYRHSGNPVLMYDESTPMVNVDCANSPDCRHAAFLEVKNWLGKYPSQPITYTYQPITFNVKVASAATEKPVPFAFVRLYQKSKPSVFGLVSGNDIFVGLTLTGMDGIATFKEVKFDPNASYYAKAIAWGFEGENSKTLDMLQTVETSPPPDLGTIKLLAKGERISLPGQVTDAVTTQPLGNVLIVIHNKTASQDIWRWAGTDTNGLYAIEGLLNGDTELLFMKLGYHIERKTLALQPNQPIALNVTMQPMQTQGQPTPTPVNCPKLGVLVTDVLTGTPLDAVSVTVSGQTQQTDDHGRAGFSNLNGVLEVKAQKSGFDSALSYADSSCMVSMSLNPSGSLSANEVRIVLNWGENPRDLDAHLTGPGANGEFHVYYSDKTDGDVAKLDTDDRDSFGPETITISPPAGQATLRPGVYRYYVHHFAGNGSLAVGTSVKLISGSNQSEQLFKPLASTPGLAGSTNDLWFVFELNVDANGGIAVVNKQEYSSGISDGGVGK